MIMKKNTICINIRN